MSRALRHPHHHHQVAEIDNDVLDDGVHLSLLLPPVSEGLQELRVILTHDRLGLVGLPGYRKMRLHSIRNISFVLPFSGSSRS